MPTVRLPLILFCSLIGLLFNGELRAQAATAGTPVTAGLLAFVGAGFEYRPYTQLPSAANFSFAVTNRPAWASFDPTTGTLSGVPTPEDRGSQSPVGFAIVSGDRQYQLPSLAITVVPLTTWSTGNVSLSRVYSQDSSLLVYGVAQTSVRAGAAYEMRANAVVRGTGGFVFEIHNKPPWAQFDPRWGRLTGTPGREDVGTYAGITITLVRGDERAQLGPFSVTVLAPTRISTGDGVATISWTAPTVNTDGSPLQDLAGYVIYSGTQPRALRPVALVKSPKSLSQILYGLPSGPNYFATAAVTLDGRQSAYSAVVSIDVQ